MDRISESGKGVSRCWASRGEKKKKIGWGRAGGKGEVGQLGCFRGNGENGPDRFFGFKTFYDLHTLSQIENCFQFKSNLNFKRFLFTIIKSTSTHQYQRNYAMV
jgi:hypothetical protein